MSLDAVIRSKPFARTWPLALLAAILVLATVLRVYDLGANPPGFFADEASVGYNAYQILHTGKDEHGVHMPLFFQAFGEYKLPVYIYSQVPFIAALGLSELAVRLTSAVYGVLTVAMLYLLAKRLFDDEAVALGSAAVLAILPWHIHYSRTGMAENISFIFFLVLSLYLFYRGLVWPRLWLLAGLSFAVTLYTYRSAWVTVPPLLIVLAALYHRELLRNRRYALSGLAVIVLAGIPILVHLASVDSDRSQEQSIFHLGLSTPETARQFFENYRLQFTNNFLFRGAGETNLRQVIPGQGWLYWWQIPLLIAGIEGLMWQPTREKLLVAALLVLYPLPSAVSDASPDSARSLLGTVPFAMITAYGAVAAARLALAWQLPSIQVRRAFVGLAAAGVAAASIVGLTSFVQTYYGEYRTVASGFEGWQWGGRAIVERFVALDGQYDRFIVDTDRFNAPEIFLRFYAPDGCRNCLAVFSEDYQPAPGELLAVRQASTWMMRDHIVHEELHDPNGEIAFLLISMTGPE